MIQIKPVDHSQNPLYLLNSTILPPNHLHTHPPLPIKPQPCSKKPSKTALFNDLLSNPPSQTPKAVEEIKNPESPSPSKYPNPLRNRENIGIIEVDEELEFEFNKQSESEEEVSLIHTLWYFYTHSFLKVIRMFTIFYICQLKEILSLY